VALPTPEPGLVIAFEYLWRREAEAGRETAKYARPCAIVLSRRLAGDGRTIVAVVPITHSSPAEGVRAIELPRRVKEHLGLDDQRSWVVTDELNEFAWPGFDLALTPGGEVAYGALPPRLFEQIRAAVLEAARAGGLGRVRR